MSRRKTDRAGAAMLELWRPPQAAGDPIGCLATTYTFAPGLFDEQCLARFLEIDSEPDREDLAFLLERESRLGGVYAGVLVDHSWAGVEHSLRWDVLPVRLRAGKQHAKLSLLAWSRHVRVIVSSANLTEQGYRVNYEVAGAVDLSANEADLESLRQAIGFLRRLVQFVAHRPGDEPPEMSRATDFLTRIERQTRDWAPRRGRRVARQRLIFTLPAGGTDGTAEGSLASAVTECRRWGGSPDEAWVASPFFDPDEGARAATAALCKLMARAKERVVSFCVPAVRDGSSAVPRLCAPRALLTTPHSYNARVVIEMLPESDPDKNRRPWHAKMLALFSDDYASLLIGSSNFTCAGMGLGPRWNVEANLLTIIRLEEARDVERLEQLWRATDEVLDPASAEWLGPRTEEEEEEEGVSAAPWPAGFLSATYRAGDERSLVLRLDAPHLPDDWSVNSCGVAATELVSAGSWRDQGAPEVVELPWSAPQPPEKLLIRWADHEAFLPINVEDGRELPPPASIERMSADEMLRILAAADPSAAFRAWAKQQQSSVEFDPDIDSATPVDLDPLRRHDLHATFLHRVHRKARIFTHWRLKLEQPAWSLHALEWRLRGMIGVEALGERLLKEWASTNGTADEALLTLADFLIVLREVNYQPADGSVSIKQFESVFRPFLTGLAEKLAREVANRRDRVPGELFEFWERVVQRCHE